MEHLSSALPDGWRTRTTWMALGPAGADGFAPNIQVEQREAAAGSRAEDVLAESRERLRTLRLPALKLGRELRVEIAGVEAFDLELSHDGRDPSGETQRFCRRLVTLVKEQSAYEIVFTTTERGYRSGHRELFDRFASTLAL